MAWFLVEIRAMTGFLPRWGSDKHALERDEVPAAVAGLVAANAAPGAPCTQLV
jgi:hypothetical protein